MKLTKVLTLSPGESEPAFTAAEVAALVGSDSKSVRSHVLRLGLGRRGQGTAWVFTQAEVD